MVHTFEELFDHDKAALQRAQHALARLERILTTDEDNAIYDVYDDKLYDSKSVDFFN